jgi:N-formylglutamate amidohydrolase
LLSPSGTASHDGLDRPPLPRPQVIAPRSAVPVVLSIAHSGRDYPCWLVAEAAAGKAALESLEDPLVDRLAWRALANGLGAVIARAPRAAIDCNRAPSDLDPGMVVPRPGGAPSERARGGLGLIPARTASHGRLWRRPLQHGEAERRIAEAHMPFHQAVAGLLDGLAAGGGDVLLLDCHSMPPRRGQAELVIGDRHGRSAAGWVTAEAAAIARSLGWSVAVNTPYAGGHVAERHGDPVSGRHALQLEIDRRCYLAADLRAAGPLAGRLGAMLRPAPAIAAE